LGLVVTLEGGGVGEAQHDVEPKGLRGWLLAWRGRG